MSESVPVFNRDHLERLLREPNNLFGPPKGKGYDYGGAARVLAAVFAAGVSTACLLLVLYRRELAAPVQAALLLPAAPNLVGYPFLWPFNLLLGLITSLAIWFATVHAVAAWRGGRTASRGVRWISSMVAAGGWLFGIGVAVWLLLG